ncbi:MAG: hypothetical protein ACLR7D_07180 [Lachnospira eligens]
MPIIPQRYADEIGNNGTYGNGYACVSNQGADIINIDIIVHLTRLRDKSRRWFRLQKSEIALYGGVRTPLFKFVENSQDKTWKSYWNACQAEQRRPTERSLKLQGL